MTVQPSEGSLSYVDNPVIPRLHLVQENVREETIRHHMNRYQLAASFVTDQTVAVDVCCGTGYGTNVLKQAGALSATGVDLSRQAVEYATAEYPDCAFVSDYADRFLLSTSANGAPRPDLVTFF